MVANITRAYLDSAWLEIGDTDLLTIDKNLMIHRNRVDIENPDRHLLRLMRDPNNFGMTIKMLMDIELHPIQIAILQEFWDRSFPMFIASRGFGKSFILALYASLKCIFGANHLLSGVFLTVMMMGPEEMLIDAQ